MSKEYRAGRIYPPEDPLTDTEFWMQDIDFLPITKGHARVHAACIVVYAENENLLAHRVSAIVAALNYEQILAKKAGAKISGI